MRQGKIAIALALVAGLAAQAAWADGRHGHGHRHGHSHGHARFGVTIGVPLAFPNYYYYNGPGYAYPPHYYYPPAYYTYPPATVVVPAAPPVYIERAPQTSVPQASAQLAPGYWYYCNDPAGYYPSIAECPGGWQQIAPTAR